jgi:parallel beta-helix repeat protein
MRRRGLIAAIGGTAVAFALIAAPTTAFAASAPTPTITGKPYPGNPKKEAAIVAAENQRIYNVRAITTAARWEGIATTAPYRLATGDSTTLVLVARPAAYTLDDLLQLEPKNLVKQPDGSYLLSENIVIDEGATLNLSNPDGLVLHLASSPSGFVSIVAQGGSLVMAGSSKAPVEVDSWDVASGAVDDNTTDGRAYVRIVGGSAQLTYAKFDHLGFWSGLTGGLALTGAESATATMAADGTTLGTIKGSTLQSTAPLTSNDGGAPTDLDATPAGGYSYVSAKLDHVTMSDNAYGIFVNGSDGISISDSTVENNLVDGIVLHRYVTNSTITSTVTRNNAVDGLTMTRASTGVVLSSITATGNGRDGVSLNGGPLASGPNATGTTTGSYGNNTLSDSTASHNGRYGIDIVGGTNVKVLNNTANGNQMGIVVSKIATDIMVKGNTVDSSLKHGIALFDGVSKSTVSENSVSGSDIAIYARDSSADYTRNRISNASTHGFALVGDTSDSTVSDNTIAGVGSSPIDSSRGSGVTTHGNDVDGWHSTKPFWVQVRAALQPLTVLWIVLGLIVLITAIAGAGRKNKGVIRNPYESHTPLSSLTRGIVSPEGLGLQPPVSTAVSEETTDRREIDAERGYHHAPQPAYGANA